MRELIKLSMLPECGGYSQLIYITEKTNDSTVNELIADVKLRVRVVRYEDALKVLSDIRESKTAYEQVLRNNLENKLTSESRSNILSSLDVEDFTEDIPHSVLFFDDAINILKEAKFKQLKNLMFQNRQPRFTVFICLQDFFSLPPQLKRNADSIWLFSGFTDQTMFGTLVRQLGSPINSKELWNIYVDLEYRDVLLFDYTDEGTKINIIYGTPIDGVFRDPLFH
jgi:hypothetical protein